jgi:hypothetical protein
MGLIENIRARAGATLRVGAALLGMDPGTGGNGSRSVTAVVDDSPGWGNLSSRPHDYSTGEMQVLYANALEAWRKNPMAWRIIAITTDYVVGDGIMISSPVRRLDKYARAFWSHPKNMMDLRIEAMCDELSRAGDIFVVLFRNPADGMSYIRFVTKDRIEKIETAGNDWEKELAFTERTMEGIERVWLSPEHPEAAGSDAVMLHYAVNRPAGALMGEGDLTSMLPWLQRYSRMLEDRVRLDWAMRAFLWMVTVPTDKVRAKKEQYRTPPESGSIIVKDKEETWEAVAPELHGIDAQYDLKAVRGMIDAGSGYPPHWRGEAADANLATAQAMQGPTERHLTRRQDYFMFVLQNIILTAYNRAVEIEAERPLATSEYGRLFSVTMPDVSRQDNESLAQAARNLAEAFGKIKEQLPGGSRKLARIMLANVMKTSGAPLDDQIIDEVLSEAFGEGAGGGE